MKLEKKYTKCKRCNRKLKTEKAQKVGYGSHCYQQHLIELRKKRVDLLDLALELEQNKNTKN